MDWSQVLAIAAATVGSTFGFFLIIREDIKAIKEDIKSMDTRWWEYAQRSDERWVSLIKIKHEGKQGA